MPHETLSSRFDRQQQLVVWMRGCVVVAVVALLMLTEMFVSLYKANNQPPLEVLPQRINPNTASMASLVRLPGIGKARALDIIHYRQSQEHGEAIFRTADDFQVIRGIGPKTSAKLEPWLVFKTEQMN